MTRSSHPIREHILDFDDDFERELRRKRKNPEPSESSESSESVSEFEEEEPTARVGEEDMAADNRTIKELFASGLANAAPFCIQYPRAAQDKTDEFELKSSLLHHIPKFHGLSMEDPNKHLKEFEVVCSSMTPVNVDGSILKMKAFPFSLLEKAKDWLYELAPGTVTSWESMKRAFFEKFFPTSRVILLRKKISGIQQSQGESFPTYYERFKTLVASCPQHQMKEELLIQYFYEGLLPIERQMLDASAGGALVDKTPMAAKNLIANRALNAQQYEGIGQRDPPQQQLNEVSSQFDLQTQLANLISLVSQMAEGMKIQSPIVCGVCSIQGHHSEKCPQLIENGGWESANAIEFPSQNQPRNDPYSNTYNLGWRDHSNFKWREPQLPYQQGGFRQQPPGFYTNTHGQDQTQPQSIQNHQGTSLDNATILKVLTSLSQGQENQNKVLQNQEKVLQNHEKAMQNQDKRMDHLEKQIGQIAEFVGQFRDQGKLTSSTIVNPKRGFETANAITLRSGKEVGTTSTPSKTSPNEDETLQHEEEAANKPTARTQSPLPQAPKDTTSSNASHSATKGKLGSNLINSNSVPPNVPFPDRFLQTKKEEDEKDILETFRKVHVNIPLLDAIKQIPKYAKFLRKICKTRKRIREKEVVHVSENVSAMLQRKLPPKCKDPGSFTIPCVIGNTKFEHVMLDLGASINVMPYSVYASMNLGELKNDGVIIQLADRSNAYPRGVLEDVLVQVDHLIFPADFYVLDMEDSTHSPPSPLLLGRPFMKTAHTKIDVAKGALTMEFGGDTINFKVSESIENPNDVRSCFAIGTIKNIGQERSTPIKKDASRTTIEEGIGGKHKKHAIALQTPNLAVPKDTIGEMVAALGALPQHPSKSPIPIPIPISTNPLLPFLVQVPNQFQGGGSIYMDFRNQNTTIRDDHYPFPFIEPYYESVEGQVVEDIPLHAVGSK
ncbi:uncharacterized protein [Pyrus communis]|uniref:uncharacterized protein n=1 Tax=Pyrus communis TaxID=23211 RepID=UPI0035C23EBC